MNETMFDNNWDDPSWDDIDTDGSTDTINTDNINNEVDTQQDNSDKQNKKETSINKHKQSKQYKNETIDNSKKDMILYILADKIQPGVLSYLRAYGLNVTAIFTNVDTARGYLLMQTNPTRIVIIDSGTGKFLTSTVRNELVDMIGVNGEDSKFTVFYTDNDLKQCAIDSLGKDAKNVEWLKFKSTAIVAAIMLKHNENYIIDADMNMEEAQYDESILCKLGEKCLYDTDSSISIGSPIITAEQISKNVLSEESDSIKKFNVVIK